MMNKKPVRHRKQCWRDLFKRRRCLDSVAFNFMRWYAGVTGSLAQRAKAANTAPLVGFSGCQGSGKSTLVALMAKVMREVHGVSTVVLSLDDFYLTKAARVALAQSIHPLFATRGVPGTHDLALLNETIAALRQPARGLGARAGI